MAARKKPCEHERYYMTTDKGLTCCDCGAQLSVSPEVPNEAGLIIDMNGGYDVCAILERMIRIKARAWGIEVNEEALAKLKEYLNEVIPNKEQKRMTLDKLSQGALNKAKNKLPQVCFICRRHLPKAEKGKTWEFIEGPKGHPVPVCMKYVPRHMGASASTKDTPI